MESEYVAWLHVIEKPNTPKVKVQFVDWAVSLEPMGVANGKEFEVVV